MGGSPSALPVEQQQWPHWRGTTSAPATSAAAEPLHKQQNLPVWRCKWLELRVLELQHQQNRYSARLERLQESKVQRSADQAATDHAAAAGAQVKSMQEQSEMQRSAKQPAEQAATDQAAATAAGAPQGGPPADGEAALAQQPATVEQPQRPVTSGRAAAETDAAVREHRRHDRQQLDMFSLQEICSTPSLDSRRWPSCSSSCQTQQVCLMGCVVILNCVPSASDIGI